MCSSITRVEIIANKQTQSVVSMSTWMMHHNEDIFPDAERFDPNRWTDPATAKALDKYLFSFGKGSRQCAGIQYVYLIVRS